MKHLGALLAAFFMFLPCHRAAAENTGREFLMSCTYGVLAGTLVGAASLAFTNQPGQNLNRLARGASFGLYAGILLGVYVVYLVPSMDTPEDDNSQVFLRRHPIDVVPTMSPKGMDGLQAQVTLSSF